MSDEELIREYTQLIDSPFNPGEQIRILRGDGKAMLDQVRREAVRKVLQRVKGICAEYPTNQDFNIPYTIITKACDTVLAEDNAKEENENHSN